MNSSVPDRRALGLIGAYLLGGTTTWNLTNVGGAPEDVAAHFGVALAVVGLLTSALFLAQALLQIPGGRVVDRIGPRRAGLACLAVVVVGNAAILFAPTFELAVALRFVVGFGAGIGFVAGTAYVRALGGTALAQGLYGAVSIAGGGLAVTVVAALAAVMQWRAPFVSAAVAAAAGIVVLAVCPNPPRSASVGNGVATVASVFADRRVWRFAAVQAATFGLSVVLGNWAVVLLTRHGDYSHGVAGLLGGLVLLGGVAGRSAGGWFAVRRPDRRRALVIVSLLVTSVAALALLAPRPLSVAALTASVFGIASGAPFGTIFDGVLRTRPDAPGVAIGVMNMPTMVTIMLGTSLFGLTFSMPGEGRLGVVAIAVALVLAVFTVPSRAAFAPADPPRT